VPGTTLADVPGWTEVADGVLQRRYQPYDVNVCVVLGDDGLLVVDTRASPRQGEQLREDLRELGDRPVRWVVNTHAHFDHTFGNQAFLPPVVGSGRPEIVGHALVPDHFERYERPMLAQRLAEGGEPEELRDLVLTPPDVLVTDRHLLDVGGRAVELVHLGRGHTDNDLLLHVPSAGAWLVGDVVEQSGPPMYGTGSFPLEWPATVRALVRQLAADDVVVPGHGTAVDAEFARGQAEQLHQVADLLVELHAAGVPVESAYDEGGDRWPFPRKTLGTAAAEAYRALG
jgi:glyoxylase-like metal-dependent hydrolase (beta-lactamase superfamily II)